MSYEQLTLVEQHPLLVPFATGEQFFKSVSSLPRGSSFVVGMSLREQPAAWMKDYPMTGRETRRELSLPRRHARHWADLFKEHHAIPRPYQPRYAIEYVLGIRSALQSDVRRDHELVMTDLDDVEAGKGYTLLNDDLTDRHDVYAVDSSANSMFCQSPELPIAVAHISDLMMRYGCTHIAEIVPDR